MNRLILWEDQKKGVCEYYHCSDSHDRQYPECKFTPKDCMVIELQLLFYYLDEERNNEKG